MGNLDRQKVLMIFGGALLCAFLMSWFVYAKAAAPKTEKTVRVVAAARDMPAGTRVREADLKTITVAEKDIPKNAVTDPKLLVDRVLLFPMNANETVVNNKVSSQSGGEGLPSTIDVGKRAVSVPVTDSSGAGGLVQPRSHVDVLFTRTGSMNEAVTTVLLENVVVLGIGRMTEVAVAGAPGTAAAPAASSTATRAATLLVTPEQAAKLEFARQQGKISLALRNPLDTTVSEDQKAPVVTAADLNVGNGPRRGPGGRIGNLRDPNAWRNMTGRDPYPEGYTPPPPKPKVEKKEPPKPKFVVDVYRGDKHVQEQFQ